MSSNYSDRRAGQRHVIKLQVRAEWDDETSNHVTINGETENVGPEGMLVHLPQLPGVGDRVQLIVKSAQGQEVTVVGEVLRLERNPVQPLAALQLLNANEEWRGLIWEPSAPHLQVVERSEDDYD